jgi:hypothetical protein
MVIRAIGSSIQTYIEPGEPYIVRFGRIVWVVAELAQHRKICSIREPSLSCGHLNIQLFEHYQITKASVHGLR